MGSKESEIRLKITGGDQVAAGLAKIPAQVSKAQLELARSTKVLQQQFVAQGMTAVDAAHRVMAKGASPEMVRQSVMSRIPENGPFGAEVEPFTKAFAASRGLGGLDIISKDEKEQQIQRELSRSNANIEKSRSLKQKSFNDEVTAVFQRQDKEKQAEVEIEKAKAAETLKIQKTLQSARIRSHLQYQATQKETDQKEQASIKARMIATAKAQDAEAEKQAKYRQRFIAQDAKIRAKQADKEDGVGNALSGFGGKMVLARSIGSLGQDIAGNSMAGQEIGRLAGAFAFGGGKIGAVVGGMELIGTAINSLREKYEAAIGSIRDYDLELMKTISHEEGAARSMLPVTKAGLQLEKEREQIALGRQQADQKHSYDMNERTKFYSKENLTYGLSWLLGQKELYKDLDDMQERQFRKEQRGARAQEAPRASVWEKERQAQEDSDILRRQISVRRSQLGIIPGAQRGVREAELETEFNLINAREQGRQQLVLQQAAQASAIAAMEGRGENTAPKLIDQARDRADLEKHIQEEIGAVEAEGRAKRLEAAVRYSDEVKHVSNELANSQVEATKVGYERELALLQQKNAQEKELRDQHRSLLSGDDQRKQGAEDAKADQTAKNREKARSAEFIFSEHERLSPIIQLNEYRKKLDEAVKQNATSLDDAKVLLQRKVMELWGSILQPHDAKVFDSRSRISLYTMNPMMSQVMSGQKIPAYAGGTDSHPGGPAWVGEQGREMVILPRGTSVIPHARSESIAHDSAYGSSNLPCYARGTADVARDEAKAAADDARWGAMAGASNEQIKAHRAKLDQLRYSELHPVGATGRISGIAPWITDQQMGYAAKARAQERAAGSVDVPGPVDRPIPIAAMPAKPRADRPTAATDSFPASRHNPITEVPQISSTVNQVKPPPAHTGGFINGIPTEQMRYAQTQIVGDAPAYDDWRNDRQKQAKRHGNSPGFDKFEADSRAKDIPAGGLINGVPTETARQQRLAKDPGLAVRNAAMQREREVAEVSSPAPEPAEKSNAAKFDKAYQSQHSGGWHHADSYYQPHSALATSRAARVAKAGQEHTFDRTSTSGVPIDSQGHAASYYQPHAAHHVTHDRGGHAGGMIDPLTGRPLNTGMGMSSDPRSAGAGGAGGVQSQQAVQILGQIYQAINSYKAMQ